MLCLHAILSLMTGTETRDTDTIQTHTKNRANNAISCGISMTLSLHTTHPANILTSQKEKNDNYDNDNDENDIDDDTTTLNINCFCCTLISLCCIHANLCQRHWGKTIRLVIIYP